MSLLSFLSAIFSRLHMRTLWLLAAVASTLCASLLVTAPENVQASTTGYAFDCYFPGMCSEGDRVVAAAAQHKGQVYGRGGDGKNSAGRQDLRVPIDCRGLVGIVLRETGHAPGLLSTVKAYQDWYKTNTIEITSWRELYDYSLSMIDSVIQDTMGPGDLIVFGTFGSRVGTHIGIYDGSGNVWNAESSTDTRYSRNAPYDGSRPGVQLDPYTGFGTRKNGNPVSGIFPIMVIYTGFHDSAPTSNSLPEPPIGYGETYSSQTDFTFDKRGDMLALSDNVLSLYPSTGFNFGSPITMDEGISLAEARIVFSPGDWNGDSNVDMLAVFDSADGSELLLYKGGQNSFEEPEAIGADLWIGKEEGEWSQLDGVFSAGRSGGETGEPDIMARDHAGNLWLYRNGDFTNPILIETGSSDWSSNSMKWVFSPGDWDKNQVADIITIDSAGAMWLYPCTIDSHNVYSLGTRAQIGNGWGIMDCVFSPGDFNGDGFTDVIARKSEDGSLWLYKGTGKIGLGKSFSGAIKIGQGWSGLKFIFSPGKFTGDSFADVLAITNSGTLLLYAGKGSALQSGTEIKISGTPIDWTGTTAIFSPGDMNFDGLADVLAIRGGDLYFYPGSGTRLGAGLKIDHIVTWTTMKWVFSPGDFDRNGSRDIIAVDSDGIMWLYSGYRFEDRIKIGTGWGNMTSVFSPGDFTGDGLPDVIARSSTGELIVYKGLGSKLADGSGFSGSARVGTGWGGFTYVFSPGDLDRNGIGDVIGVKDGKLYLYMGSAKPGFSSVSLQVGTFVPSWAGVILNN